MPPKAHGEDMGNSHPGAGCLRKEEAMIWI